MAGHFHDMVDEVEGRPWSNECNEIGIAEN